MKKLFFLLALLLATSSIQAQKKWFTKERLSNDATGGKGSLDNRLFSWGYFMGFNSYAFKFDYKEYMGEAETDILVESELGFNVGLIADLRLHKHINLRFEPGLIFNQRDLTFPGIEEPKDYLREVKSTYIHMPLLVKFSTKRLNNVKPFVVGGVSTSLNLASNEKNPEDNSEGRFRMKASAFNYEIGFGIDFYLYFFKFTPSIRGVFGLGDELVPDEDPNSQWTGNIDKLSTRGIFVNFTFQ
ncbi:porin family protein [Aequorivita marina]|uniref:type IX secretion/gliding motility protein PorT/SprT n=1 Tax=Aequorivita marina TaxID=3073654 RepID=UPI0028760F64|nr:porin family protein [Aequorivita sp. S2608]MDS1298243.1 porin family protein [Aequorivita sp. S2608]